MTIPTWALVTIALGVGAILGGAFLILVSKLLKGAKLDEDETEHGV